MILIHQLHRQTDGRTDGRHVSSLPRYALVLNHEIGRGKHVGHFCRSEFTWRLNPRLIPDYFWVSYSEDNPGFVGDIDTDEDNEHGF